MKRNARKQHRAMAALLAAWMVLWLCGCTSSKEGESTPGKTVEEMLAQEDSPPVFHNGRWYSKRTDVEAYLLIGVDRSGEAVSSGSYNGGGQADMLMLLVVDRGEERFSLLQINRDTMTDVDVLGLNGEKVGTQVEQITLAYSYADGLERSGENTVRAVSRLLYDIDIDGYAAVGLDAIPIVNDKVGGVSVTIEDDFSQVDPTLIQGKTLTLTGQQALHYVRNRFFVGQSTNVGRMERHRQYFQGLLQRLKEQEDPQFFLELYEAVRPYLVTDMGSGTVSALAQTCREYENGGILTLPGQAEMGEEFVEFYPDEIGVKEIVLELFYQEHTDQAGGKTSANQ